MKYVLVILGGGSAGFAAATKANDLGIKAAIVNAGEIGGTCVNRGCVPSKLLIEIGNALHLAQAPRFKSVKTGEVELDFKKAMEEKRQMVQSLRQSNYVRVMDEMSSIDLFEGSARFVGDGQIEVGGTVIEGKHLIIATGSRPQIPPLKGTEDVKTITSEEALGLDELPDPLVVIGGGALGLEFAQMYSRFGTSVTVLEAMPRILPGSEPEISEELTRYLLEEGIRIHTGVEITELSQRGGEKQVHFGFRGGENTIVADQILFATGRRANTEALELDKVGVDTDGKGFIRINEYLQTTNPRIYAAGDCVTPVMLETLAARMGNVAVTNILEGKNETIDIHEIPRVVFTYPQAASVGYTDEEYSQKTKVCSCNTISMKLVPKAQIVGESGGVIKMVVDPRNEQIVGVHIVSTLAAEIIHEATLAVKFKLKLDDIISTTHVFPTMSEAIKKVAQSFKRDVSTMSCCIE